ncbi:pseudouridylate synthase 7 homolog [Diabrotica virgifera virgifera]|uniref:TRUD domain-containing protein n=1 Tax=Diabrotica virgifera virgifera TaxID=50390 RepID=A0ABM5ISM2_DIAVI|nr:pseudouridylate synthase 7 homolog [Diabrotica virgifera virgifera]
MNKRRRGNFRPRNFQHNQNNRKPRSEYLNYDQLSEKDVGITEYLGDLEGFSGIIKARYSDFHVSEINLEGKVAKLTDTNVPKDFSMKMIKHNYHEVIESPNKYIPQEIWEGIKEVIKSSSAPIEIDIDELDKDARLEIHNCVKSHFGQKIVSSTIDVDGKKKIQFKKFEKGDRSDVRYQWPPDKGEYVYFILYKEKMDTLEATLKISSALHMNASKFTQAGTKDKRAVTTQWFCVRKVEPWKLIHKTKNLYNIRIGNFEFKNTPLSLGQLKGNKFRIALRNVTASDEVISAAMEHLKENGFINYYGLQRFGNDKDVPTFQVGISLLQGKWKEAIDLILKPKASDDPNSFQGDVVNAKKIYMETGDATKAYDALQNNKSNAVEAKLLEGLRNANENDYVNALEKVPKSMRLLYLHAFQSLVWNRMVSKRLQIYGMKPVVGDLILVNNSESNLDTVESEESNTNDKEEETEVKSRKQVRALTEEDLEKYNIYDIVMPLPGFDSTYPENMKEHYKEVVEELGLDLSMSKQSVKTYNLSGDYRKMLEKAEDVTWYITHYNNPTDNLILSDLQELKGEVCTQIVKDGTYKALIMEFALPPSAYATMVLRQIMKVDTATNVHSKLNDYHQEKTSAITSSPKVENQELMVEEDGGASLLSNAEKYEQFKNSVFNIVSEATKNDIIEGGEVPNKKQKLEETNTET